MNLPETENSSGLSCVVLWQALAHVEVRVLQENTLRTRGGEAKLTWEHIVAVALAVTPGSGFYVESRM